MAELSERGARTLEVAEQIARLIEAEGARVAVIGAVALAVHGHPRATRDLDLGTELDPFTQLRGLEKRCVELGFETRLVLPDAEDPLGGVLRVDGSDFDPIEVVNFFNPLSGARNPAAEALAQAALSIEGSSLRVVGVPHLVALKLYAGGLRSKADAVALLEAQTDVDVTALRELCARHGLAAELEEVLAELAQA